MKFPGAMNKLSLVALGLVLLSASLAFPRPANAASGDGFNLTTSPLPVNLNTLPGKTVTTPIRIENTGTQTVHIKVSLMKFGAYGSTGEPEIETPSPNDAFIKWASFSQTSITAQPGVFYTVTMTIKVPKTAAFGYYYAVVFSQDNGNAAAPNPNQNKVNGAIATLVLLDVNAPGEKRALSVSSFVSDKKFYEYLPASFTIHVKNTGNTHVIPSGNIFISRNQKNYIATLDINKSQGNVLPDSSRVFTAQWSDGFPVYQTKRVNGQIVSDGRGRPVQLLQYNFNHLSKLRIGHYYAHMDLVYNDGKQDVPVEGDVSFWVIPWGLILKAVLIPVVPALLVYLLMRWRIRRKYGAPTKRQGNKS